MTDTIMTRRRLLDLALKSGAGAGLTAALPGGLMGRALAAPDRFGLGVQSAPDAGYDTRDVALVSGTVPAGLKGTYYLNGPAGHGRGGQRYTHWFDGDGMVHAFSFADGAMAHRGRYVETEKYLEEREAGKLLYPAFGTMPENHKPVTGPDTMNVANISVLNAGDDLLALWEGGSAYALDPATLATRGRKVLGEGLEGVPFSAHPRVAADGTIWNFGHVAFTGTIILYHLNADGSLNRFKLLQDMPHGMIHDFIATENHLVLGFPPLTIPGLNEGGGDGSYIDRFTWNGDAPRDYIVIAKADFSIVRRHELPAAFQFHHFNGWEEADGTIRLSACRYDDSSFVEQGARDIMTGKTFADTEHARIEDIVLYANGRTAVTATGLQGEFPVFHPAEAESRARSWFTGRVSDTSMANTLFARGADGDITASWSAEADTLLGEHVVIPGADGKTWLIGTQFDAARGRSLVSLFDGDHIDHGPLALWRLPYVIPIPLHGTWVMG
ncbi:carotenoid oxygenase family protein [Aquisalinus flavus]|uniref:Dioxygenase n=1 Tax=Aquisalinus flavus TaxID=1526572 RepID=A0A8J2Y7N6_9PROT|nr:carotenoid oxygenase family protein [Aquisalinus flavus]MBD0425322.1 carotenoid oxygenase family protein [Aquisalinus flavus]UNE49026.1 hypothetical protein FF099_13690 [Aquisalinus flavus]GGD17004.1 hypothetical protein GCM10011342_27210 [Aquisalinus flavus]